MKIMYTILIIESDLEGFICPLLGETFQVLRNDSPILIDEAIEIRSSISLLNFFIICVVHWIHIIEIRRPNLTIDKISEYIGI
jgi:hypothetical protein